MIKTHKPPAGADVGRIAPTRSRDDPTGRVQFDDRGNAIWEWAVSTGAFGRDVSTEQLRRLEHPGLAIADDVPPADGPRTNPLGTVRGYDPYDSGQLDKRRKSNKKDLRKLSDWIAIKKRIAADKSGGDR